MKHTYQAKNLGCRINRAELDALEASLHRHGFVRSEKPDVLIINSCCVTHEAEAKTRKAVRKALKQSEESVVFVTGCSARLHPNMYEALDPKRVKVFSKSNDILIELLGNAKKTAEAPACSSKPYYYRPNIKIQDGCNKRCSYCCVWQARGPARSVPLNQIIEQVQQASNKGAREVVLCGVDIGSFAADGTHLPTLLRILQEQSDIGRFRLSSIEPTSLSRELFEEISASRGRIAPFLHVPLQSGSDAVLKRMKRAYSQQAYIDLIQEAQAFIPSLALSTDVIVGFPGETHEDFCETKWVVEQLEFSNLHVFQYSQRENTEAATMANQLEPHIKHDRSSELIELGKTLKAHFAQKLVGRTTTVSLENSAKGVNEHLLTVRTTQPINGTNWATGIVESVFGDELLLRPTSL